MEQEGRQRKRVVMILYDGSLDRVNYAFSIAVVALAMDMDTHILFANGALMRLVKGHADGMGKEKGIKNSTERGLANGTIPPVSRQLEEAKKMGLRVYACVNSMANLNVSRDELIGEVDKTIGLASFLALAGDAITLFI